MDDFKLVFREGRLFAIAIIGDNEYEKDVTDYFEANNPHDDWLDYRLELKAKNKALTDW